MHNHQPTAAADPLLDEVLAAYLKAVEAGTPPDQQALLIRHPQIANELAEFLVNLDRVEQLTAPLRALRASAPGAETAGDQQPTGAYLPVAASSPADLSFPAIPGYQILAELGRGGMGVVYKAEDERLKRPVAIKQMLGRQGAPESLARFRAEAEAIARLQHPHIVQIHQAGEQDGQPFFVLEYVSGGSLAAQLRGQAQPVLESVKLVLLLARAVHAAHQAGVIHRDLKPANVLLAPPADEPSLNSHWGCPRVSDFGLARLAGEPGTPAAEGHTASGVVLGTPSYMAPEQAEGRLKEIGPATDVWALGVILYELLSGRKPFQGASALTLLNNVCDTEPEPLRSLRPEVPEVVAAVVERCLRKQPGERYPSAAALADDLKRCLDGASTLSLPLRARPTRTRFPWLAASVVLLAVALGGAALWNGWFSSPNVEPRANPTPQAGPFKGWIDALVSEPMNPRRQTLRLHEPGARPLRPGDEVRVEVVLKERPGYIYVLWIDARGKPIPIHPWQDFDWSKRPPEKPVAGRLLLPLDGTVYPIEPSPQGLETLVLLVRDMPLPADVDVPGLLGDLGEQSSTDREYVRWFENGQVVTSEPDRAPGGRREANDPAERTQGRIKQRLGERFTFSRAVSFFNLGKK